jgi:hypothetical protein
MNRDRFVAANWRLPLMSGHRTSQVTALRQGLGAHTFPLIMKTIPPITGRRANRTGATEKWAPNISAGVHPRCQGRKEFQLYLNGKVKQADLVRVFVVSAISVKRAVKLYEEAGPRGFWQPRPTRKRRLVWPRRM